MAETGYFPFLIKHRIPRCEEVGINDDGEEHVSLLRQSAERAPD